MSPTNKEMQLLKTCQLYAYVLSSQRKEVPEYIEECAVSYDYLVDCTSELVKEIESLDKDTLERIMYNPESYYAQDLAHWWEMYQEADKLRKQLFSDS